MLDDQRDLLVMKQFRLLEILVVWCCHLLWWFLKCGFCKTPGIVADVWAQDDHLLWCVVCQQHVVQRFVTRLQVKSKTPRRFRESTKDRTFIQNCPQAVDLRQNGWVETRRVEFETSSCDDPQHLQRDWIQKKLQMALLARLSPWKKMSQKMQTEDVLVSIDMQRFRLQQKREERVWCAFEEHTNKSKWPRMLLMWSEPIPKWCLHRAPMEAPMLKKIGDREKRIENLGCHAGDEHENKGFADELWQPMKWQGSEPDTQKRERESSLHSCNTRSCMLPWLSCTKWQKPLVTQLFSTVFQTPWQSLPRSKHGFKWSCANECNFQGKCLTHNCGHLVKVTTMPCWESKWFCSSQSAAPCTSVVWECSEVESHIEPWQSLWEAWTLNLCQPDSAEGGTRLSFSWGRAEKLPQVELSFESNLWVRRVDPLLQVEMHKQDWHRGCVARINDTCKTGAT